MICGDEGDSVREKREGGKDHRSPRDRAAPASGLRTGRGRPQDAQGTQLRAQRLRVIIYASYLTLPSRVQPTRKHPHLVRILRFGRKHDGTALHSQISHPHCSFHTTQTQTDADYGRARPIFARASTTFTRETRTRFT